MGKVKTRLAATVGKEKALEIYHLLLRHTFDITCNLPVSRYIFYEDFINEDDMWVKELYSSELQQGFDLGDRMNNAFEKVFSKGHTKVIIVGSDCFELSADHIAQAFDELDKNDAVIGPAVDGGYYLLGIKKLAPEIFLNIKWSTNSVFRNTLEKLSMLSYKCAVLQELTDVDEASDLDNRKLQAI